MNAEPTLATQVKRTERHTPGHLFDVLCIGAGPTGMACAIEAQKRGLSAVLVDKGCLVNSIYHYPANMVFFTTPELLEIGDIPFTTAHQKPTRQEALEYYRHVAQHYRLDVRQYERVVRVSGKDGDFHVETVTSHNEVVHYHARKLVVATGYYDLPNRLGVPGEDLPKVFHYYREPHPFYASDVVVIGGKNSAAEAALDLWRHGARVTLVHRGHGIHANVKYWLKPDIENRIRNAEIAAYFNAHVREILPDSVLLSTPEGDVVLENDFVFALIGYHPDFDFLRSLGIELSPDHCRPLCDPESLESNIPGLYVAGVIVAGSRTSEIFIENGRFHGHQIAEDLKRKLKSSV
ncbi:MAG TPA: YpdA family putative bacillithiol disulfide reductase [Terriglobales bacterium]|nr:YpdA family putative bacillithiol disulfide reductase [Terriglobales bacterium]